MEFDSFLVTPRWEILKLISERPSSPLEISEKLGVTVSYVSQQLKLLEVAGLVRKEKTGEVERGKPRNIYSISKEVAHITSLSRDFSIKKTFSLDILKKILIRVWSLEKPHLEDTLYRVLFSLDFNNVSLIFLDESSIPEKIFVFLKTKDHKEKNAFPKDKNVFFMDETKIEKLDLSKGIFLYNKIGKFQINEGGKNE